MGAIGRVSGVFRRRFFRFGSSGGLRTRKRRFRLLEWARTEDAFYVFPENDFVGQQGIGQRAELVKIGLEDLLGPVVGTINDLTTSSSMIREVSSERAW